MPLSAAVSDPPGGEAHPTGKETGRLALDGVHVVAVDDDADSLELIAEVLQRSGADVRTAQSADEALRACRERMPEVLVADIGMPGMDGLALMRELRGSSGTPPALALTAYAGDRHRRAALDAGFVEHLEKPVNPDQLVAVVADVARRRAVQP